MIEFKMKKVVTIIKTRDNEIFELNMPITEYFKERDKRLALWKKTIFLKDFKYDLTITNVLSSREKTKHIPIEVNKVPQTLLQMGSIDKKNLQENKPELYYKMLNEEKAVRKKNNIIIKEQLEKWKDRRAKKFIERRNIDFIKLAATEKTFWLKTTLQKLQEREQYKRGEQKNILKDK